MSRLVEATGLQIEADAKKLITENKAVMTGDMRRQVQAQFNQSKLNPTSVITAGAEYSNFIEYGTGIYREGGGGRRTPWIVTFTSKSGEKITFKTQGMKPRPFLRPAYKEQREKFLSSMRRILQT